MSTTARVTRALVTGASAGLGEEFARQLAAEGTDLVLVARRGDVLESLAATLRSSNCNVEVMVADLATSEGRAMVSARIGDDERSVDLLVNNAGFGAYGDVADLDADTARRMVEVNIVAVQRLAHAALTAFVARRSGGIINVASTAAFQPNPHAAVYGATKSFVRSFSQALSEEVNGTGVVVTAVCPGVTATEFQQVADIDVPLPDAAVMTAQDVVRLGLGAHANGRAVVVTGVANAITANVSNLLPDVVSRRLSGLLHERFS